MHHSKRFGCLVYLCLSFLLLAPRLRGQSTSEPSPAAQTPAPPPQPENPEESQIRLARQAQARIRARREQRVQKAIADTYSHKFEVYGGGGYLRFRPGSYLEQMNEAAWNAGVTDYIRGRLGITADVRGYYGNAFIKPNPFNIFKPSIDQYTFLGGPQYRVISHLRWAVGAQVLAGVAKGTFNANSAQLPGTLVGMWSNGTVFAASLGAPVDINLGPGLAARIMPSYLLTTFGGSAQIKGLGFTAGIVYRFGRQQ